MAPLTLAGAFTAWQFAPLVSAALMLLAAAYLAGVWLVARRHRARPWPASRTLTFLLGLGAVAVATQGSAAVYDDVLFSVHMVQHLLLIMVAPPLLILGRPVTLLLRVTRSPLRAHVKHVLRSPLASALTWPPAAVARQPGQPGHRDERSLMTLTPPDRAALRDLVSRPTRVADLKRSLGVETATRRWLAGGVMPLWLGAGLADWYRHKQTRIEDCDGNLRRTALRRGDAPLPAPQADHQGSACPGGARRHPFGPMKG